MGSNPFPNLKTKGVTSCKMSAGLQKIQLSLGGPCPDCLAKVWTLPVDRSGEGQERTQLSPGITGRGGRRGKNILIHRPTHPLPLISLPEFYSSLYRGGAREGQDAGYRRLRAPLLPSPALVNQLLREASGSSADPAGPPSAAAPALAAPTEEPRRVLLERAGCRGRVVNSGRRPGWLRDGSAGQKFFPRCG